MFARFWPIYILLCLIFSARAVGQATQPASTGWEEAVHNLAKTLTDDSSDISVLDGQIPEGAAILKFGSTDTESRYRLRQQTGGLTLVSARGYAWPMESLASDLATDVRSCDSLTEAMRQQFVPRDDAEAKRANVTAQQWVAALLHPAAGQFVGVILLWEPPASITTRLLLGAPASTEAKQPVFVLVKAQKNDAGEFHVTHIIFGDARQALN